MELGTGIFLSSLFLGTIALFVFTKDRWNWKKIVLRGGLTAVALIALVFGAIAGMDWYNSRPHVENEMVGIRLGTTQSDVTYLIGEPKEISKDGAWTYASSSEDSEPSYTVRFTDDGKVRQVHAYNAKSYYLPNVANVSASSEKGIEKQLGKPTRVEMSKDNRLKILIYDNYHVWFGLRQDELEAVGVYDPAMHTPGFPKN